MDLALFTDRPFEKHDDRDSLPDSESRPDLRASDLPQFPRESRDSEVPPAKEEPTPENSPRPDSYSSLGMCHGYLAGGVGSASLMICLQLEFGVLFGGVVGILGARKTLAHLVRNADQAVKGEGHFGATPILFDEGYRRGLGLSIMGVIGLTALVGASNPTISMLALGYFLVAGAVYGATSSR